MCNHMTQRSKTKPSTHAARSMDALFSGQAVRFNLRDLAIAIILAVLTFSVFVPALHCGFVNFDDPEYVLNNTVIHNGFSADALRWALTANVTANWHPLTLLSHVLDCQMFGVKSAWGHHLTSIALHSINAGLLFVLMRLMTGAVWRSAMVALLFAIHPLRVESVVWIAERKDVLSTFFGVFAMLTYMHYVRRPGLAGMIGVCVLFVLSLLSKPMFVTLPFLLLLLDWWPLRRWAIGDWQSLRNVAIEKTPLLAIALVFCIITIKAQHMGGAVRDLVAITPAARLANTVVAYFTYVVQMFWPVNLAIPYPFPLNDEWPTALLALAVCVIVGATFAAITIRNRAPWFTVGWCWFIGMLVPVIGLVQVGSQSHADRYTYLPMTGLLIAIVWLAGYALQSIPSAVIRTMLAAGLATIISSALIVRTREQIGFWSDSISLFSHTIAVTGDNAIARNNLGTALADAHRFAEAETQFREAVRIRPNSANGHLNLGNALSDQHRMSEAIAEYSIALKLKPDYPDALHYMGRALAGTDPHKAIEYYEQAIALKSDYAEAHNNLGAAYGSVNQLDQAFAHFQRAVQIKPEYADAHCNLGAVYMQRQMPDQAVHEFEIALRLNPHHADALRYLPIARQMQTALHSGAATTSSTSTTTSPR